MSATSIRIFFEAGSVRVRVQIDLVEYTAAAAALERIEEAVSSPEAASFAFALPVDFVDVPPSLTTTIELASPSSPSARGGQAAILRMDLPGGRQSRPGGRTGFRLLVSTLLVG